MRNECKLFTTVLIAACAGNLAIGQPENLRFTTPPESVANVELTKPQAQSGEVNPSKIGLISRSSKLLGHKIQDENYRGVGNLTDILVDLSNGRVVACVVEANDRFTVVPPSAFFPVSEERIVFNAERDLLKAAPEVKSQHSDAYTTQVIQTAHKAFKKTAPSGMDSPLSVTRLIGKELSANTGAALGRIEDVVVDIPKGEALYVVVRQRPDSAQLYAVPPTALRASENGARFSLSQNESHFMAGPNVPNQFWTEMTLPKFAETVYRHYGVGDLGSPAGTTLTPTGRSDEDVHNAILRQIVGSPTLATVNAKDLQITASNGIVTLSGIVRSQGAREELVGAAGKVVGPANVNDRLTVK